MYIKSLSLGLSLLLIACVDTESANVNEEERRLPTDAEVEQYNAQVDPSERIVCRQETQVGSNIPSRKCYLVRNLEEVSSFHREQLRNVLR